MAAKRDMTDEYRVETVDYDSVHISEANEALRSVIADTLPIFRLANTALLVILFVALGIDVTLLVTHVIQPSDRLVNSSVVLALIAATAAEISAIIVAALAKFR